MPTNKKSIIEDLNGAGKQPETTPPPPAQQATPKAPLHHANIALQGITARQAETDAVNDAKLYATAYSQAYALEVLRLKGQFLQSFHTQSNHSQAVARDAITQDGETHFFSQGQELNELISQLNAYTPPALPSPTYNLLPPSLG